MEETIFHTTEKHFEIFQKECLYWIKKLSLLRFEFFFANDEIEDRADVSINDSSKIVIITLSKKWYNIEPTSKTIRRCAFHEICEVLLNKICEIALRRDFKVNDLEAETHSIIRLMENIFFVEDYNRRFIRKKR